MLDEGIATLRNEIVCFNVGSVIIKPVQRILKYSLILGELIKVIYFSTVIYDKNLITDDE